MTSVTVIIPTYNRAALLKQAIESVLAVQSEDMPLEVLVIDDGSSDDTAEVVKQYPVVYLRQPGGLGPAGARNVGIEAAHGEYIAFIDDDDVWLPSNVRPQVGFLQDHPEYALVFAPLWYCDNTLAERLNLIRPETEPPQWDVADLLGFIPQVGTVVVRRAVAQEIPFDAAMRMGEDWDWSIRVAKRYPVGYVPVPAELYRSRLDEAFRWQIVHYTRVVFRRHRRAVQVTARRQVRRALAKRMAGYAWRFIQDAKKAARERRFMLAAQAMGNALRCSPQQVGVLLGWSLRKKLSRRLALAVAPAKQGK